MIFLKCSWNIPEMFLLFLNVKMAAGALLHVHSILCRWRRAKRRELPLMQQIWRAACEAAVTQRAYQGRWIIDARFKHFFSDVTGPELPAPWKNNACCRLTPLKLMCRFHCSLRSFLKQRVGGREHLCLILDSVL